MAAALADSTPAPARCSACHADLDVTNASSHVCQPGTGNESPVNTTIDFRSSAAGVHSHQHHPSSLVPFPGQSYSSLSMNRNGPLPGKLPKFAPPARIDPFAANESYMSPAELSAEIRAASPFSNPQRTGSASSGRFRMPPRSTTTPTFRERPPSAEMRMPQDCAFPMFPTKKVREDRAKRDKQRSKSMSRNRSDDRSQHTRTETTSTSTSRSASPAIPQSPYNRSMFGPRKSSMSGPRSRGDGSPYLNSEEPVPPIPSQVEANVHELPQPERFPSPPIEPQIMSPLAAPPISAGNEEGQVQPPEQSSQKGTHFQKPSISAAIKPLDAIGSARKPNHELGLDIPRSQSASGHRVEPLVQRPFPAAEAQSAVIEQRPYPWSSETALPESPVLPQSTLPTMEERIGEEEEEEAAIEQKQQNAASSLPTIRPIESVNEPIENKIRESVSSDGSSYSVAQSASSRSSPPTSASSFTLQNDLPRGENIDTVLSEIAQGTKPPGIESVTAQAPVTVPLQQRRRGPAKSFSRPNYMPPQLELPKANMAPGPGRPSPQKPETIKEESPRQESRSPRSVPEQSSPGSATRSPLDNLRSPPTMSPMSPRLPHMPRPIRPGDPYANVPPSPAGSLRRPTTPGFKGNCRGCGELIVGKSVSSADGRLTGRYHKHCFVCRTCKEPFQTADFYVIDNHPYCHRHYHTLNGSLCTVCDRGIEGPYMETDGLKKFHPHCFTCKECHLILRHDYFEVNGVIYCEKHSKKTDLLSTGGRRNPERRTTRLMMM